MFVPEAHDPALPLTVEPEQLAEKPKVTVWICATPEQRETYTIAALYEAANQATAEERDRYLGTLRRDYVLPMRGGAPSPTFEPWVWWIDADVQPTQ